MVFIQQLQSCDWNDFNLFVRANFCMRDAFEKNLLFDDIESNKYF